jgi:hypothetical protein
LEQRANIFDCPNSTADRQRHKDLLGCASHHVEHDAAVFVAGGDVKKNEFIRTFDFIALRDLDWIAGISEIDEVRAFHHAALIHI